MARPPASECFDADLLCKFLREFSDKRVDSHPRGSVTFINGWKLTKSQWNCFRRWEAGEVRANLETVDRFFTSLDLHIDQFVVWCELEGKSPWLAGEPPAWQEECWDHEDSNWKDPVPEPIAA